MANNDSGVRSSGEKKKETTHLLSRLPPEALAGRSGFSLGGQHWRVGVRQRSEEDEVTGVKSRNLRRSRLDEEDSLDTSSLRER